MQNELHKLQRVLAKEVGENVSLDKILEEGSGWRGRAQKIALLKANVRDLKAELRVGHLAICWGS